MSTWGQSCPPDLSPLSVTQFGGGSQGLVSLDTSQSHAGLYSVGFTLLIMLPQWGRELALSACYVPGNFLGALQKLFH